jgi:hypothetical protein
MKSKELNFKEAEMVFSTPEDSARRKKHINTEGRQ